jgi:transcriptional regulator with XRE-family HTH domain
MKTERSQQPEFGRRVRRRREELGLSQRDLAGDLVTPSSISLVESGQRSPTLDLLLHLATTLQMPLTALIGQAPPPAAALPARNTNLDLTLARSAAQSAAELGDHHRAADLLAGAYATAVERGEPALQIDFGLALQNALRASGRHPDRRTVLEALAEDDQVASDPHLRVVLFTELAAAQRDTGMLADARTSAYSALSAIAAAELTGGFEHVRLLGILVSVLCELNDLGQVELLVEEMIALAAAHDPPVRGRAAWAASIAYSQLGMATAARRQLDRARVALAEPDTSIRDWLRFMRSAVNVLLDDAAPGEALTWLEAAEQVGTMLEAPQESTRIAALRARYELATGAADRVVELYPRLTSGDSPLTGPDLVRADLVQADALAELGRTDEAEALLRSTAARCDGLAAYELEVRIWKRIDELRS